MYSTSVFYLFFKSYLLIFYFWLWLVFAAAQASL